MSKMRLISNLPGQQFEGFCLVKSAAVRQNVKGADYLDMVLADCDGEAVAKLWDYHRDEHGVYDSNDIVKVRGSVTLWKDTEQLKIDKIRPAAPGEADMAALVPCAPVEPERVYGELMRMAEGFGNGELKLLVQTILREERERLMTYPAAVKLHHATRGGLLHHTWSVLRLAGAVCDAYPTLDRELLATGVILHDIGKLDELDAGELGLAGSYTTAGQLIGHINIGVNRIGQTCDRLGIGEQTRLMVMHMLLSHHGVPEFGSPRYPMFPEAEVLSEMDLLDSRLYEMNAALEGVAPGGFSERQWALDNRQLYRRKL